MYTRQHFRLPNALVWTYPIFVSMGLWSTLLCVLNVFAGLDWLYLPPLPVTVLGTAVSFYLGFKGNAAYGRLWEARKIWGGIVNTSRTWGIHVTGMVTGEGAAKVHRELLYRHVAWLAALRIRLRRPKPWEHRQGWNDSARERYNTLDTSDEAIRTAIGDLLDSAELDHIIDRKNQATQLLKKQSDRLRELRQADNIEDFRHMELAQLLETMFTLQGKAERIKNFPLPRQYATANHWFVKIFITLVPLALIGAFKEHATHGIWMTIPASMVLGWVFFLWTESSTTAKTPSKG